MKISIAADHAGFNFKEKIKKYLLAKGFEVIDRGTFSSESVDYPDFISLAAEDVSTGKTELGIGICGTGMGVSIVANKKKGVRAALALNSEMASLSRRHNDANFLAIGARLVNEETLMEVVDTWLAASFEGGRHKRRVDKIENL